MMGGVDAAGDDETVPGDVLLDILSALASPYRLRILAALVGRRQYVSELAREIGMSRPLLHMHLRRLQSAGLVSSTMELSGDGRAMNYLSVTPFAFRLTPESIAAAVETLPQRSSAAGETASAQQEED